MSQTQWLYWNTGLWLWSLEWKSGRESPPDFPLGKTHHGRCWESRILLGTQQALTSYAMALLTRHKGMGKGEVEKLCKDTSREPIKGKQYWQKAWFIYGQKRMRNCGVPCPSLPTIYWRKWLLWLLWSMYISTCLSLSPEMGYKDAVHRFCTFENEL